MTMFPVVWEDAQSIDGLSDLCPYSLAEIEEYLFRNHYAWMLREAPTAFAVSGPFALRRDTERRYWLFEACDGFKQQQWFIIVGSGKSPFNPAEKLKRWMYAKTNDDNLTPDQFLDEEYREQITADALHP
jgi:hypothetical protein